MPSMPPATHGGNRAATARRLGCRPADLLDLSASLAPYGPPAPLRALLLEALLGGAGSPLRDYPDRSFTTLRRVIARLHGLESEQVLPGNGAAELFTWLARDAAALGPSLLPQPGFADYRRALACWGGAWRPWSLPLAWGDRFPAPFPLEVSGTPEPAALWLTNPHNPTGQLWSRASLEGLLERAPLVIVDEAFLPLCPHGEGESLLPLVARHPQLVVIRSLTKLYGLAGLRLAYAVANPERLRRWASWRDPWPLNGLAVAAGEALLAEPAAHARWCERVRGWVRREGAALAAGLAAVPGLEPLPSATNFVLVRGRTTGGAGPVGAALSLEPLRRALESRHRILLRDCRSFPGLDGSWLRIALSDRRGRQRLLGALAREGDALVAPATAPGG
ncbi:MAG: aminotransferase class I/II-fold pyridoxal phosphate-dependent enzyme [Cyanobacteriota bacterium]|nr:aminotransferase class I/II-fold pyridoxal phosphate-dependent enzyme [Cyanobacteriota bacterium]